MRKILIILLCLGLAGCATTAGYEAVLNNWKGSNIDSLINSWGYPTTSFIAPDGNTVYVYVREASMTMPTQTTVSGQVYRGGYVASAITTGGETLDFLCKTYLEVNQDKIIVSWHWEGNSCRANMPQRVNAPVSNETVSENMIIHDEKYGDLTKKRYFYLSNNNGLTKTAKINRSKVFENYVKTKKYYDLIGQGRAQESDQIREEIISDIHQVVADYADENQIKAVYDAMEGEEEFKNEEDISDKVILILNNHNWKADKKVVVQSGISNTQVAVQSTNDGGIEDKLRTLNKLLADGLITKDDFEARKQKLLDEYTGK